MLRSSIRSLLQLPFTIQRVVQKLLLIYYSNLPTYGQITSGFLKNTSYPTKLVYKFLFRRYTPSTYTVIKSVFAAETFDHFGKYFRAIQFYIND
jgi:hypothetical protein